MSRTRLSLFILVLLIDSSVSIKAQWFEQNNPAQNNSLNDIFVFDEYNAIVVGGAGSILKTNDGGENWLALPHDTTDWPSSVYFLNDSIGWIAGFEGGLGGGMIQKTYDGGETWVELLSGGCCNYLENIQFVNENIGWVVGQYSNGAHYGIISKTTDGGVNWTGQNPFLDLSTCTSLFFINNDIGWVAVAGLYQTILKTTDGGDTWEDHPVNNNIYSIFFIDYNTGWAVGWQGGIFKTSDGGENWINQLSGVSNKLNSVQFVNQSTGWVVGANGTILKTNNGGENWIVQPSGTNNELYSVCFTNENTGWIVGENGTILKTINGGVTSFNDDNFSVLPKDFLLYQNYPNPFNPTTKITYSIPYKSFVSLKVYDPLGNEISQLVNEEKEAGNYEVGFDVSNLSSGIYFYSINAGSFVETRKMILMK